MYTIVQGKAYLIEGEVGYEVNFDIEGRANVDKSKTIDVKGKEKYTYDEIYRKLNVAYVIKQAKMQNTSDNKANATIEKLNKQIEKLTLENEDLKAKLEALKTKDNNAKGLKSE